MNSIIKKLIIFFFFLLFLIPALSWAYEIPSDRVIDWNAGLDPVGGIPGNWSTCITSQCDTLYGGSVSASTINAAINSSPDNSIIRVPAGSYTINNDINLKSNVILRGAKNPLNGNPVWLPNSDSGATTLNMGSNTVNIDGGSQSSTWYPGPGQGTSIISGYTQGSRNLTLSSASNYNVGDYISIYQDSDSSLPINYRGYGWLGEDNCDSYDCHVKQQYTKIVSKSGNQITIEAPIYLVSPNPYGQAVRKVTFGITKVGVENIRFNGNGNGYIAIFFRNALYSWVKGVETYNYAGGNGGAQIMTWFSKGIEIRDSYVHYGGSHSSGRSYGIGFYYWNSDHKVENNIISDTRHAIIFEGGNSGTAVLFNYGFNNWESEDTTALTESFTQNHGAHPHMDLWEGNIDQQFTADWTQGSASHNTLFRNWGLGWRASPSFSWWEIAFRAGPFNRYFNYVGNVAGIPSWTSGTAVCVGSGSEPCAFEFGDHTNGSRPDGDYPYTTAILHGNYDYITDGVHDWQGGSDHNLKASIYYDSIPNWWCSEVLWPSIGPDVFGYANDIPAKKRYDNQLCTQGLDTTPPLPPAGLMVQ